MTEHADEVFLAATENFKRVGVTSKPDSAEYHLYMGLSGVAFGLSALATALRQTYDKLVEIERKLPKR